MGHNTPPKPLDGPPRWIKPYRPDGRTDESSWVSSRFVAREPRRVIGVRCGSVPWQSIVDLNLRCSCSSVSESLSYALIQNCADQSELNAMLEFIGWVRQ